MYLFKFIKIMQIGCGAEIKVVHKINIKLLHLIFSNDLIEQC